MAAGVTGGCAPYQRIPPPPGVSFAAHIVPGGFLVDRMNHDEPGLVTRSHWLRLHHEPALVVREGASRGEGIWLEGPGRAIVRATDSPDAPIVGRVEPSWSDKAIRLRIEPVHGTPISSEPFVRTWNGLGPSELTRAIERDDELYGRYRSTLHAPDGTVVGWLEVRVGDEQASPMIYDGVLPPEIDEGLAAASAAALRSEIAWIGDHTLDSFPGFVDRP